MQQVSHLLIALPNFFAYLGAALALTVAFSLIYTLVTPHSEWNLLRNGNLSAAVAFGGALLGFVIPLASTIAHSVSLLDMVVWGAVALVVQLMAFFVARLLLPALPRQIEEDRRAAAAFSASLFLAVGILNAACMVW
jgi:putative membrane protein